MVYTCKYKSPLGDILLAADEIGLTGLWFEGQNYFADTLPNEHIQQETEILTETKKWLDMYFAGEEPKFTPHLHPAGSEFRQTVWKILLQIPYGQTISYGAIARKMAEMKKISHMSAQAVGGAVGHNEISIIIPCHRVVGANGNLTGYAGGIDKKISLLELEHADMRNLFINSESLSDPGLRNLIHSPYFQAQRRSGLFRQDKYQVSYAHSVRSAVPPWS